MKKLFLFSLAILTLISLPLMISAANNELDSAVSWLYQNGLTQYTNTSRFKAANNIRRDEASKFFSEFASTVLEKDDVRISAVCKSYPDVDPTNTMKNYVFEACSRGYILGSSGKFYPRSSLSNAQAIAIIIRILEGNQDESGVHWSDAYYQRAEELGLLDGIVLENRNMPITRGILGVLLYRAGQLVGSSTYSGNFTSFTGTQPDLILTSASLDPNHSSPKVNDEHVYLKFTIKNIGKSITFTPTNKAIVSCSNNALTIRKEIKSGTLTTNGTLTIDGVTNIFDPNIYVFITPENEYTFDCLLYLDSRSTTESVVDENNYKQIIFPVVSDGVTGKPDFIIDSLSLDSNYLLPKSDDPHVYLSMMIRNIGETMTFTPTNKAIIDCYGVHGTTIISTSITGGTVGTNQTLSLSLTNPYNPSIYLFPAPENNYVLHCGILISTQSTVQESAIDEKNYKSIYFDVGTGAGF